MNTPQTASEWREVCVRFLNGAEARQATPVLNEAMQTPESILRLAELLQTSPEVSLRQLACVLLRKRISGHWSKLPDDFRGTFPSFLLERLTNLQEHSLVRRSLASLVAVLAAQLCPQQKWPALFPALVQLCGHETEPAFRETGFLLLGQLLESIGALLQKNLDDLLNLFARGLQDNEARVRVATMDAMDTLSNNLSTEAEAKKFGQLLPLVMKVIQFCVKEQDEEQVEKGLRTIAHCVDNPLNVVADCFADTVKLALQVAAKSDLELGTRAAALELLTQCMQFHRVDFIKTGLIGTVLVVVFQMYMVSAEEDALLDSSAYLLGSSLLCEAATVLPAKYVFSPSVQFIQKLRADENWLCRRAAVATITLIAHGCVDLVADNLEQLLKVPLEAVRGDPHPEVRKAGCRAITELTVRLAETSRYNRVLLEALFPRLDDPELGVVEEALEALRTVCYENMAPDDVLPVLPALMQKLEGLLRAGVPLRVQQFVVRVLGAVATAAEEHFVSYMPAVVERLLAVVSEPLQENNQTQITYKVHSMETLGLVATSVGATGYGGYLKQTMAAAVAQLVAARTDDWELRECTWALFANLAITFEEAFAPFLPGVVPFLFESALSNSGVTSKQGEGAAAGIEGDEGDLDAKNYQVRESFVDEKEGAVQALGMIAEHTGTHFLPFVEHTCATLQRLVHYFAPTVRAGVLSAYPQVLSAVVAAYPPAAPWRRGSVAEKPHADVLALASGMLKEALAAALDDSSKEVCAKALQTVGVLAKKVGPCVLGPLLDPLHTCCQRVLAGQVSCQRGTDCFDDEDEQLENLEVFDGLTELLVAVSATLGASEPGIAFLKPILPRLLTYCREEAALGYRQHAIGTLGDVCVQLGPAFLPYLQPLWPMALHSTSSPSSVLRRNAIYTAGCLVELARKPDLSVQLLQCAVELREDEDDAVRDNMAGAVARAICAVDLSKKLDPTRFPLADAVRLLLSLLPLTEDREPIEQVLPCLVLLCTHQFEVVRPYLDRVLDNFLHELAQRIKHIQAGQSDTDPNIVQAPVAQEMISIIKRLSTAKNFGSLSGSLTAEQR
eukprot:CAMPEP_0174243924 /NCGR_PEP_ID=MMETSP0417-20130205/33365_1 /TAXON_ID=242541 /ORGANISM="Mayorella sp, Strain BSH-02190019" /LENGTH=1069 /DNA_ID=CAMNT_0015323527 /DNA_START=57 /DNA_END=3263 /DNA_ORIENTATION=-